jgi:PadR family transcriptional regulator, regulatory protein PadR
MSARPKQFCDYFSLIDILPKLPDTPVDFPLEALSGGIMKKQKDESIDMLQGTLDMLILRTLLFGPKHGHAVAKSIEHTSQDVLRVDHGSLYPALQRMERRGLITAKWGTSENNRRARYYRLTAAGRKMLVSETGKWERLTEAIARILNPNREEV